ncbi:hypothetical protein WICPIJ_001436 [Wickerhamomyces pijperi]|uniref:THIF-type NAD/FAD binding fold domain-containing protein n=1 Tax=Wickerhamomyces pijperi TaxID=599730 RepID=A0A9P8TQQ6_WICPI|nr:hypothetical protein WICPIJ_001436 [Wickerhamomyces pijperi]
MSNELSADEIALYDRQLRVWGAEGQTHLKNSRILLLNFTSLGCEIIKNLILAGVGSVEIYDSDTVKEQDFSAGNFFLSESELAKSKVDQAIIDRVRDLNPRVNVTARDEPILWEEHKNMEYFRRFNLIIANNLSYEETVKLNAITREAGIALYLTVNHGIYGLAFNDLLINVSTYVDFKNPLARVVGPISRNSEIVKVEKFYDEESEKFKERFTVKSQYKPFIDTYTSSAFANLTKRKRKNVSELLSLFLSNLQTPTSDPTELISKANELQTKLQLNPLSEQTINTTVPSFLEQQGTEIAPVSAIMGGALAQDIINFISKKVEPMDNLMIFDGVNYSMPVYEM